MKNLNIFLTILFILFAAVQYNDPDPLLWIVVYAYVALICGMAVKGKYSTLLIAFGIGFCFWGFVSLIPDFIDWIQMGTPNIASEMKTEEPHIELVREFLGYLICTIVLVFQFFQKDKLKKVKN